LRLTPTAFPRAGGLFLYLERFPMPQSRVSRSSPGGSIADQLERLTPDWDRLVHDARRREEAATGRPDMPLDDLEERAQQLVRAIVAPFRGDRR